MTGLINADNLKKTFHSDGHWVHGREVSRDYIGNVCVSVHYDKWWCSECNYPVEGQPLWRYCPNCGAIMDEVRVNDSI